jgi:ribosome-associated protein
VVRIGEAAAQPMGTLDPDMGELVTGALRGAGVKVLTEEPVKGFETTNGRVSAVVTDGTTLPADVVILDMRPVCSYTDFFVICTGQNPRQTKAIYNEVHEQLKRSDRLLPQSVAGVGESRWIVADYLDVVLHVFTPEAREYYRLEELWDDVPSVEVAVGA